MLVNNFQVRPGLLLDSRGVLCTTNKELGSLATRVLGGFGFRLFQAVVSCGENQYLQTERCRIWSDRGGRAHCLRGAAEK